MARSKKENKLGTLVCILLLSFFFVVIFWMKFTPSTSHLLRCLPISPPSKDCLDAENKDDLSWVIHAFSYPTFKDLHILLKRISILSDVKNVVLITESSNCETGQYRSYITSFPTLNIQCKRTRTVCRAKDVNSPTKFTGEDTKIRAFDLHEYKKVVVLEKNVVITKNSDELFCYGGEIDEVFGRKEVMKGVTVLHPSNEMTNKIQELIEEKKGKKLEVCKSGRLFFDELLRRKIIKARCFHSEYDLKKDE